MRHGFEEPRIDPCDRREPHVQFCADRLVGFACNESLGDSYASSYHDPFALREQMANDHRKVVTTAGALEDGDELPLQIGEFLPTEESMIHFSCHNFRILVYGSRSARELVPFVLDPLLQRGKATR